jgi:hypothetical protein
MSATPTATASFSVSPTYSPSPTITPTFTPSAPFVVSIQVYNAAGEQVAFISSALGVYSMVSSVQPLQPGFSPDDGGMASILLLGPGQLVYWDGMNSDGQMVAGGVYYIKVEVKNPFGQVSAFSSAVNVLRSDSPVFVEIFNSAGELVRSLPAPGGYQSVGLKLSHQAMAPGVGAEPLTISFSSGGSVTWDGLNSRGEQVSPGNYQVKVRSARTGLDYAGSVTVLKGRPAGGWDIEFYSNPHKASTGLFRFSLTGLVAPSQINGSLYNAAGELVARAVPLGGAWLGFAPTPSSGIYFVEIVVQDQGQTRRIVKKAAIIH